MKKESKEYAAKEEQKIRCKVQSCKHQDNDCDCCNLKEVEISCNCGCNEAEDKDITICKSFECDHDKLQKDEE